jgi:xanthine/CO dehydrogenase XdhC/CoxF family maturation factor
MLTELWEKGFTIFERQTATIYVPALLDIGAETAKEIGLFVLAEM